MALLGFAVVLLLVHLNILVDVAGTKVSLLSMVTLPVFFVFCIRRTLNHFGGFRGATVKKNSVLVLLLTISYVALAISAHAFQGVFSFKDFARIVLAIATGYGIYSLIRTSPSQVSEAFFALFLLLLLVLAFAEVFTPLGEFMLDVTKLLHPPETVQRNIARDISIAHFARPLVFTTEPSHVAKTINLLTVLYVVSASLAGRAIGIGYICLVAASLLVVRSPILLGSVVLLAMAAFDPRKRISVKMIVLFSVSLSIVILGLILMGQRFSGVNIAMTPQEAAVSSEFIRLFAGFVVAADVLQSEYFLFGAGFDADKVVAQLSPLAAGLPEYAVLGNNAMARLFIMLGASGAIALALMILSFGKLFCERRSVVLFFVYFVILATSTGSISGYLFWYSLFIVAGIANSHCQRKGGTKGQFISGKMTFPGRNSGNLETSCGGA